jgi:hypothetical protein
MKQANDDLIALFANSRQIVAKDRYTFTLGGPDPKTVLRYHTTVKPADNAECVLLVHGNTGEARAFYDSSSLHTTPVPVGTVAIGTDSGSFGGKAVQFAASEESYVYYNRDAGFLPNPTGDFTFECWIRITENPNCAVSGGPAGARNAFFRMSKGGVQQASLCAPCIGGTEFIDGTVGDGGGTFGLECDQAVRRHVVLMRRGRQYAMGIDGTRVGSPLTFTGEPDPFDFTMVELGNPRYASGVNSVGGLIDEARIMTAAMYDIFLPADTTYTVPTSAFSPP